MRGMYKIEPRKRTFIVPYQRRLADLGDCKKVRYVCLWDVECSRLYPEEHEKCRSERVKGICSTRSKLRKREYGNEN